MEIIGVDRDDLYLMQGVRKVIIVDENGDPVTPGPGPGPGGEVNTADWDYKLLDLLKTFFTAEDPTKMVSVERYIPFLKWTYLTHPEFVSYAVVSLGTADPLPAIYLVGTSGELTINTTAKTITSTEKFYTADLWRVNKDSPYEILERDRGTSVNWGSQPGPLTILGQYKRQIVEEPTPEPVNIPPMFVPNYNPDTDALIFVDRRKLYRDPSRVDQYIVWLVQNAANMSLFWDSSNAYEAKYGPTNTTKTDFKSVILHGMTSGTCKLSATYTTDGFSNVAITDTIYPFGFPVTVDKGMDNDLAGIVYATIPTKDVNGNLVRKADTNGNFIKTR